MNDCYEYVITVSSGLKSACSSDELSARIAEVLKWGVSLSDITITVTRKESNGWR